MEYECRVVGGGGPLILVGEIDNWISNYSSNESLSAGRVHFAEHGPVDSHNGAQGRETNETRGMREISKGDAGGSLGWHDDMLCGDDQNGRSGGAVGAVTAPTSSRGGRRASGRIGRVWALAGVPPSR